MSEDGDAPALGFGPEVVVPTGPSKLQVIVKEGTRTSAYDKEQHEAAARAEAGRQHQDKQRQAAAFGTGMTKDGFVASSLTEAEFHDRGAPRVVFNYLNADRSIRQQCVSELVLTPGDELFTLQCPRCLERGVSPDASQLMIKKSHRKWYLDTRRAGELVICTRVTGDPWPVRICGTITCDDAIRCSNVGCSWEVRIEDSKVMRA